MYLEPNQSALLSNVSVPYARAAKWVFLFLLYQLTAVSNQPDSTSWNQICLPNNTPVSKVCVSWNKRLCLCEKRKIEPYFIFLQEVFGYRTQNLRRALCFIISALTCGVLLLVFYWKPQWRVWASCIPCHLQEADTVLLRTTVRALLCHSCGTVNDWPAFRINVQLFKSSPVLK